MIFHVVSFKFKPDTDASGVKKAFAALKNAIPEIRTLDGGVNVSAEGHDRFANQVGPLVDDVFVVDFAS